MDGSAAGAPPLASAAAGFLADRLGGRAHENATPAVAVNALVVAALDDRPAHERQLLLHVQVPPALRGTSLVGPGLILTTTFAEPAIDDDGDVLASAKPVLKVPVAVGVVASHDEQQHQRAAVGSGERITVAGYRAAWRFPKEFVQS